MRHAPPVALVWSAVLLLLTHAGPPDELLFGINGALVGWCYLRYCQPRRGDSLLRPTAATGDASASFAFSALWPPPLRPPLDLFGTALFGALSSCCCGLFPPPHSAVLLASGGGGSRAAFDAAPLWPGGGGADLEAAPSVSGAGRTALRVSSPSHPRL
mmetsp:Transcript_49076/g.159460  ORF Transcript_49076/g.159460 Transcript_49076/m.159460 type:complete len:158 (+) Transcript_49076:485-958(+)